MLFNCTRKHETVIVWVIKNTRQGKYGENYNTGQKVKNVAFYFIRIYIHKDGQKLFVFERKAILNQHDVLAVFDMNSISPSISILFLGHKLSQELAKNVATPLYFTLGKKLYLGILNQDCFPANLDLINIQ